MDVLRCAGVQEEGAAGEPVVLAGMQVADADRVRLEALQVRAGQPRPVLGLTACRLTGDGPRPVAQIAQAVAPIGRHGVEYACGPSCGRQYYLGRGAQHVGQPWRSPPEQQDPRPYDSKQFPQEMASLAVHVPGEEIGRRHRRVSQQLREIRIPDGEHGHLGARAFIAQRTGRVVDDLGRRGLRAIPVVQARSEPVMHIAREKDDASHDAHDAE